VPYWRDLEHKDNVMAKIWKGSGWAKGQWQRSKSYTIIVYGYFNPWIVGLLVSKTERFCDPQLYCKVVG
jgi:hypothetical protein